MDNLAAYTAVPYEGQVTHQTDPDNLAVVGRLLGLNPVPPSRARILEIGCADGGNLVPIAARLPAAEIVGLDLTPRLIESAQVFAERAGVTNVRWLAADIADPDLDLGPFDYILVHGVWSWVPDDVREAILARIGQWLSPDGLATVSYNVWPGWSLRSPMRGMLTWHAGEGPPQHRLARSRQLAAWLNGLPSHRRLLGRAMRSELADVAEMTDWYLFHEHLAADNQPVWFHEFMARAQRNGLSYVGDAEFADMVPIDLPGDVQDGLEALATDRLTYEQYLDFARERAFRRTIVGPADAVADYGIGSDRLSGLHVGARLFFPADFDEPGQPSGVSSWSMGVHPKELSDTVGLLASTDAEKQVARRVAAAWPSTVPVDEVVAGLPNPQRLRQWLLLAYLQHGVRLFAEPRESAPVSSNPTVRPSVRAEATLDRDWVTTHWHRTLAASPLDRALLRALTGGPSVDELAADLTKSFALGRLPQPKDLFDAHPERVRTWLDTRLSAYANALLLQA